MKPTEIIVRIATDNAAFEGEEWRNETARLLRDAAQRIEEYDTSKGGRLKDVNGNTVGFISEKYG